MPNAQCPKVRRQSCKYSLYRHDRNGHDHHGRHGRHGYVGHYGHHGHRDRQRGQTDLTFKFDFPGNLSLHKPTTG